MTFLAKLITALTKRTSVLALFGAILLLYLNRAILVSYLPDNDFKLKVGLFVYRDKMEHLVSILNQSEYSKVFWIRNNQIKAAKLTDNELQWTTTPNLNNFVYVAQTSGFAHMLLSKATNGNWQFIGYKKRYFLNNEYTRVKYLDVEYSFGVAPDANLCSADLIMNSANGKCYLVLNTTWFIYKYWYTLDVNTEQN